MTDLEGMPTSKLDVASIVKTSDTLVGNQDGKSRNFKVADIRGINDTKESEDTTYSSKQINKIINTLSSLSNEDLTVVVNAIGDLTTLLNSKAEVEHTHIIKQITDMPTSMKNPESLKLKMNGIVQAEYNGEESKEINITPENIGAAKSNHTHRESIYFVSGIKDGNNNYNVDLEAVTEYYNGLTLCLNVDSNSSGESTIKINDLDIVPLLDSEGSPLEADTLKAGIPYHICYCGTNFIVLGKGGDKGTDTSDATALAEDILINKSAYGPNGKIEGAIPINSGTNKVLALNETYNIPKGYQDGSSKVTQNIANNGAINASLNCGQSKSLPAGYISGGTITANSLASQTPANATAAQILAGFNAWVNGSLIPGNITQRTGHQLAENQAYWNIGVGGNAQPQAFLKPPLGYFYGDTWIRQEVPDLLPQNILSGKNILGCVGTAQGRNYASGTFPSGTKTINIGFTPTIIIIINLNSSSSAYLDMYYYSPLGSDKITVSGTTFTYTGNVIGSSSSYNYCCM